MQICLTVIEGPHQGQVFTFGGHDTFLVGRSKQAHFRLPHKDKYFSRIHFLLEVNPPRCRVVDMGSRNGTYVNGQKISATDLKDGDLITAGHTVLRLGLVGDAAEDALPPLPPVLPPLSRDLPPLSPQLSLPSSPDLPPPPPALTFAAHGPKQPTTPNTRQEPSADPFEMPAVQPIKGYQLLRELGHGGMGVVYLARRLGDQTLVALKTILPAGAVSTNQLERFLREANILQQLDHPNIVRCLDLGESNGRLYFAMEYVPGTDSYHLLKQQGPLPIRTVVDMMGQILAALEYAHHQFFVHRDIKPSNVLVAQPAAATVVKLADFGLARVYQSSQLSGLTMTGEVGGSAAFMPPEQITQYREAKPHSDQYAAAATMYNLLTDRYIYDLPREIHQQFAVILNEDPVPIRRRRPEVPEALAAVIHRALAREPQDRFPDVGEFRKALLAN
jgi:serine/threonine-protein kinase